MLGHHPPRPQTVELTVENAKRLFTLLSRALCDSPNTTVTEDERKAFGDLRRQLHQRGLA